MISTILPQKQPQTITYNYPCGDLLERERRREFIGICVPLYKASIKGDWEAARIILKGRENMVRYSITEIKETPLHLASRARSYEFVRHLLDMMEEEDLKLQNKDGNTAFCVAAIAGDVRLAKIMVAKNRELLTIRGCGNMMPLYLAASNSSHEMVKYLYCEQMATDGWTDDDWTMVFIKCIECELFDVAIRILDDHEEIVLRQEESIWNVLYLLAKKPYAFYEIEQPVFHRIINSIYEVFHLKEEPFIITESDATQLLRKVWKKVVLKPTDEIDVILQGPVFKIAGKDGHPSHVLFVAAEMCNTNFLVELIDEYPDLIWKRNDDGQTIFHIAAFHRHESIYRLLYEIGSMKDTVTQIRDKEGNNMLHSVAMNSGKNPHDNVWGAAYQMRHELLWFKEVSSMVSPQSKKMKNAEGLTPSELFSNNHKALALEGESLIKGTIGQSLVAATLISTIGFSVVFTIPGGYDQNNGYPIFLQNKVFMIFVILDAISFILSSFSIIMFLNILVSSYGQNDFAGSLLQKLVLGQATLLLSIFSTMIAFGASFFILYHNSLSILIALLAAIPAILLSKQQYLITEKVFHLIFKPWHRFHPKRHTLHYQNPRF